MVRIQSKPTKNTITKMRPLSPGDYEQPFMRFMTDNPTVFHAVSAFEEELQAAGFTHLSERSSWSGAIELGGKYYITRNNSSLVAFTVGHAYKNGNGIAMIAGHIDANTLKLKPVSKKPIKAGYVQLGVAPYAGGMNITWWDRDLSVGGKVLVKDQSGKTTTRLVKLGWPIARIPTLAPHFGIGMTGSQNKETEMVPIVGLDNSDMNDDDNVSFGQNQSGSQLSSSFVDSQPPALVRAISKEMDIDPSLIIGWELELFDAQPAQLGGLGKEFIFACRLDDKLCSWAAIQALIASSKSDTQSRYTTDSSSGIIKLVATFDNEEIGSTTRQGARSNFLPSVITRITESLQPSSSISASPNALSVTYANSFLVSADVTHAGNPNFLGSYMADHTPRLNTGIAIKADANGRMTTDSVSTAILRRTAEKSGNILQTFMAPGYGGGTIGPMLSATTGVRAVDVGIPQLSMHSVRATTGNLDPGLGVMMFKGFLDEFESVDKEFDV